MGPLNSTLRLYDTTTQTYDKFQLTRVAGRRVLAPRDVHVLIPRTCEYVTLHGKRDSTDLEMGR